MKDCGCERDQESNKHITDEGGKHTLNYVRNCLFKKYKITYTATQTFPLKSSNTPAGYCVENKES